MKAAKRKRIGKRIMEISSHGSGAGEWSIAGIDKECESNYTPTRLNYDYDAHECQIVDSETVEDWQTPDYTHLTYSTNDRR